jgi:hypothetical protein
MASRKRNLSRPHLEEDLEKYFDSTLRCDLTGCKQKFQDQANLTAQDALRSHVESLHPEVNPHAVVIRALKENAARNGQNSTSDPFLYYNSDLAHLYPPQAKKFFSVKEVIEVPPSSSSTPRKPILKPIIRRGGCYYSRK